MLLHYKKTGSGPVVVLLHGFLLSLDYWHDVQKDLEKNYTVISIDLLGFGHSPKPKKANYTIGEQVAAIHDTLSHLEVQHFTLVGHSMGGVIAAAYANKYPSHITKLLLYMPPIFLSPTQAHLSISTTNTLYRLGLYSPYGRALWLPIRAVMQLAPYILKSPQKHAAKSLRYSRHRSRTLSQKNIIEGAPLPPILENIEVSTILFVGKVDRQIYQHNLSKHPIKNAKITLNYIDAGHHFLVQNPTHLRSQLM